MINLKLHTRQLVRTNAKGSQSHFWSWLAATLFRQIFEINIPNLTMERGESLIIHSEQRVDLCVAVKVEEDGRLVLLLSPPSVKRGRIELRLEDAGEMISEKTLYVSPDIGEALRQATIIKES